MKSQGHMKIAIWGNSNKSSGEFYEYFNLFKAYAGLLSRSTGMTFEISEDVDLGFNKKLPNGSWSGIIGMVQRGEVDVALDKLILSEERKEAVDFTYPFRLDVYAFATKHPEFSPEMFACFHPFALSVWLTLALFFISTTVSSFVTFEKNYPLAKLLFQNFAAVTGQYLKVNYRKAGESFLFFSWIFGMMLLTNCYRSVLLSFLAVPALKGIRDFTELTEAVLNGGYQCVVAKNSFIAHILLNSDVKSLRLPGKKIHESTTGYGDVGVLLDNPSGNIAYINAKNNIEYLSRKFFISKDHLNPILLSYAVNKKFCCIEDLDKAVVQITDTGLFTKLFNDIEFRKALRTFSSTSEVPDGTLRSLSLFEVSGIFIVLICGYFIATIALVLEILYYNRAKPFSCKYALSNAFYAVILHIGV